MTPALDRSSNDRPLRLLGAAALATLAVLTWLTFRSTLEYGLLDFDDRTLLLDPGSRYRGFGADDLRWMFTTFHMGHYQPLSWLSYALDHAVYDGDPRGFHRTNLILHVLNAILFAFLCSSVLRFAMREFSPSDRSRRFFASVVAAALFAVHPLRVESVAWVTERRDVLSLCFLQPSFLAWLAWIARKDGAGKARRVWFALSVVAALLSLMAKAWAVTLPIVLLLLDAWPLRRLGREPLRTLLLEKLPFVAIALPFAMLAAAAQHSAGASAALEDHPPLTRLFQATYGLCFYVGKTLWPVDLGPMYPLEHGFDPMRPRFLLCFAAAVAVTAVSWLPAMRRRAPGFAIAWLVYAVILTPVLGFTQAGAQIAADRYTYVACLPWAALAGWALLRLATRFPRSAPIALIAWTAAAALVLLLAHLSREQTRIWRDDVSLWSHGVAVSPDSLTAHYNCAKALMNAGRNHESIQWYENALTLDPHNAKALQDVGAAYARTGRYAEAEARWRRLLEIVPEDADALFSMGLSAERQGKKTEALQWYERTLRHHPEYVAAKAQIARLRP